MDGQQAAPLGPTQLGQNGTRHGPKGNKHVFEVNTQAAAGWSAHGASAAGDKPFASFAQHPVDSLHLWQGDVQAPYSTLLPAS